MATHPIDHERAEALPTALLAQAVPMLTRHELEALTERLIEALDILDGDVDAYENDTEDAFAFSRYAIGYHTGPGCPISDPDAAADDVPCDEPLQDLEPEEERDGHLDYAIDQSAGPLPLPLSNDAGLRRPHIERVRRDLRMEKLPYRDVRGRTHRIPYC